MLPDKFIHALLVSFLQPSSWSLAAPCLVLNPWLWAVLCSAQCCSTSWLRWIPASAGGESVGNAPGVSCVVPAPGAGTTNILCSQTVHGELPSAWLWLDCSAVQSLLSLLPTFLTPWHLSFPYLTLSQLLHYSPSLLQGLLPIPLPTSPGFSPPGVISVHPVFPRSSIPTPHTDPAAPWLIFFQILCIQAAACWGW